MTTYLLECGVLVLLTTVTILLLVRSVRKLAEARKALAHSQERLSLTLRSAGIAVWSWDIAQNIITPDENCLVLFGLPSGEFPRTVEGFAALVHPDDRERVRQEVANSVEHSAEYNTEFRVVWPEGAIRHLAARAKVYRGGDGRPSRLTGVSWDITERRQAEENLRATNEKLTLSLRELELHKEQSAHLSEMADLLQACSSSREAYDIIAQFCGYLFPRHAGALYIFSASRNLVNSVATWNHPLIGDPAFEPDDCWALRRGHPHVIEPGHFATPCRHLKDTQIGHACFPLMAQGTGLGIMYFQHCSDTQALERFFSAEDQRLAVTVAEQVALSLANLHLQEALRLQTIRDPLTGLFNRRYLEESVERELHRMARRQQPAGFVMMDLDHFKTFNDTFGHEGGDALLRAFGQFLKEHLRKEDIACRYGGEEFCILFCESSLDNTVRLAEQLRSQVKHLTVQHNGQHLGAITVSSGVAAYPAHGATITELIAAADGALYQAKTKGRDRVVTATTTATP